MNAAFQRITFIVTKNLEIIRIAFFSFDAFIPDFAENQLVQFVESFRRIAFSDSPQRIMGLFEDAGQFVFLDSFRQPDLYPK